MQIHLFSVKRSTEELSIQVAVLQYDKLNTIDQEIFVVKKFSATTFPDEN